MSSEKRYYHVQLKYTEPPKTGMGSLTLYPKTEQEFDLSEEDATELGEQYSNGCIFFKGKWIETLNIEEIEIRETTAKSNMLYGGSIFQSSTADVVTRRFIKSPPRKGSVTPQPISQSPKRKVPSQSNDVFIVHGNDHTPMRELKTMLYDLGLNPIVLHEQPSGSKTVVEKLEHYSDVGYAFVILTPDDIGSSVSELKQALDAHYPIEKIFADALKKRARQNVVLEFGYFINKLGRSRVCCLYKGDVELPSDMQGIVYIPFRNSVEEIRVRIMKELKQAGYDVRI